MDYEQVDEDNYKLNIADFFRESEKKVPGNPASQLIKAIEVLPCRTAPCMIGTIRAAVENFYSDIIMNVVSKDEKIHLDELGDERSVFVIDTNPFNATCSRMINIMYGQMFKSLFEKAEKNTDGRLNIPIHVICDDFACSTKINGFERYISIFRQAGISVSILLQSESQLKSLYGEHAGTTILNNMDTYIYMGSQDVNTVTSISKRMNLPFDKVMYMERESVMISRRGCMPFIGKRYKTYEDPVYKMMMASRKEERP
jgi:type IV secretory pathway TraG/TraD family ATPase VirD4